MLQTYSLNKNWTLKTNGYGEFKTSVPCSYLNVLLKNKKIPDPFWRENEYVTTPLCDDDCEFEKTFTVSADALSKQHIFLRFEGIDTISDVMLNGEKILSTDNMHRTYEVDVTGKLGAVNSLNVKIYSPTKWIEKKQSERPLWGVATTMSGYPHMRKAHCMFGWDWGPKLPDMGIWRAVSLVAYDEARIKDVYFTQEHNEDHSCVKLTANINANGGFDKAQLCLVSPDDKIAGETEAESGSLELTLEKPQLWWCNGLGSQPLYTAAIKIYKDGCLLDEYCERIGIRTLEISQDSDEFGQEFCFKLNGEKIFSMGANYIPEDQLIVRQTAQKTRRLLEDCAAAGFNTIRVWGGGVYPSDSFYDACDELGLIVWQDFMFACSAYILTPEFESTVSQEIRDNVLRLRNHASLGLWCGNNEIESMWVGWGLPEDKQATDDYLILFEQLIPEILEELDPERFYHPSSPSSGGGYIDPSSNHAGDMHYWDIWHNYKPIEDFKKYHYRFCSEYGFESVPSLKTCLSFSEPEKGDLNLMSPVMEAHQKCEHGNEKLMLYLAQTVRYPYSFKRLIYSSQLMQSDCIRSSVEHMRRNRGRCMGSLYWQVNDSNPVISWSSIDYFGRWKALHYAAKKFYAPVLLSVETDDPENVSFCLSNETLSSFSGTVKWKLRDNDSEIIRKGKFDISADALNSVFGESIDLSGELETSEQKRTRYIDFALLSNGMIISQGTKLFVRPKEFEFIDPKITAKAEDYGEYWLIRLDASAYVKSVCLDFSDRDARFEDNWFDINAGEKKLVMLKKDKLSAPFVSADELVDSLTIESCYE